MTVISLARPRLAWLLGLGLATLFASSEGRAYTPEQQEACTPDAFRLCSAEIPDVDRITACMIRNKAQLSPQCRAFFRSGPDTGDAAGDPPGKPLSIKPAAAQKSRAHKIRKPKPDDT
jgi:hypothetical protein